MKLHTLHIRHMCCQRCIEAVETTLTSLGLKVKTVELGTATFETGDVPNELINEALIKRGFELIVSEDERLIEEIKIAVIELVHHSQEKEQNVKTLHVFLEKKTLKPFRLLNKLFSKHTQLTIQKYTILQRIERVKELIQEERYNFSEIADILGYRSPQHLSGQFKKNVGISMLEYKMGKSQKRIPIDKI